MASAALGSTYLIGYSPTGGKNQVGNKEDVLDLVINIDPFDTPFVTMAPKTTCSHTLHEWVQDTLAATATATSTWNEGAAFSAGTLTSRSRVINWCEIFRKDIEVSNTQRAVSPIGVRDEYAYQIMKASREIARDMENAMFRPASSTATGASDAARKMKTFESFLQTNSGYAHSTFLSNTGTNDSTSAYPIYENDFNSMLQAIYQSGGNPDVVFVSPSVKRQISKYDGSMRTGASTTTTSNLTRNIEAAGRRVVAEVNFYESDFGPIQVILDRWVPQATNTSTAGSDIRGRMVFLERTRNRLAFLRPLRHVPLPPAGDSTRGLIVGELTYECLAEKGSGILYNVNNYG